MTFKTLPFIVWNKVYHKKSALGKTPNPKDMLDPTIFKIMALSYLGGLVIFAIGIMTATSILLNIGSLLMLVTAILYNFNVFKVINHKALIL